MFTGISKILRDQLDRTGTTVELGDENLYMEQSQLGAATNDTLMAAGLWLEQRRPKSDAPSTH